jgi:hypothetical protein
MDFEKFLNYLHSGWYVRTWILILIIFILFVFSGIKRCNEGRSFFENATLEELKK